MTDNTERTEYIKNLYLEHVNPSLMRLVAFMGYDVIEDHSRGSHVYDIDGNDFIDCLGGFGVFSIGHSHPKVIEAVKAQLDKMPLTSKVLLNEPLAILSKKLADISPGNLKYAFICNSGTEAIEGALKLARVKTGRSGIIYTTGGFHGKTMGSLSITDREDYQGPFKPLIPGARRVPFGDIDALASALDENTACLVLEPMQGESGIHLPPDDYLSKAQEVCHLNGSLIIADEVQTGLGRTGKLFACEHYGLEPDLMTLAKALGGGVMPIGAILGTPEVWDVFEENPLIHSSTFGGNPLACSAGIAAIDLIVNENYAAKAAEAGNYLIGELEKIRADHSDIIEEVRGRGCFIGVDFSEGDIGGLMISALAARKVLVAFALNNPKVLRVEPPLDISREDCETLLAAFRESVEEVSEIVKSLA